MQVMIDTVWLIVEFSKGLAVGGVAGLSFLLWLRRTAARLEQEAIEEAKLAREREIETLFAQLLEVPA